MAQYFTTKTNTGFCGTAAASSFALMIPNLDTVSILAVSICVFLLSVFM